MVKVIQTDPKKYCADKKLA